MDAWPGEADADVRAATRSGVTDAQGLVEVPELDAGTEWDGSLIWARAAGKQSQWLPLPITQTNSQKQLVIRLPPSADVEVTVLGEDSQPVTGALVSERADFGDWPMLSDEARDARQFEFLPRFMAESDSRGIAHLPVFPVRASIQATAGAVTSPSWTGIGSHHVTLRLVATCEVEGRVIDESGADVGVQGAVSCQVRRGIDGTVVVLAPIRKGGAFGPVRLPLASDDGFMFQYFGGDLEAAQVLLAAPAPGSRSSIEIRTRAGLGVNLHVTDDEGHPLPGVTIATQWSRNDVWNRIDWRTNSEGRARLAYLPTGEVWVRLRKPGFVPELRQLYRAEQWARAPLEVRMSHAATVEGRCTSNGRPANTFTVYFWNKDISDGGKVDVEDSTDGSFRIEEAAPGLVQLVASSPDVVQSAQASLTVSAGGLGTVTIELPAARVVRGQVVDAASGEAIPNARVAVMLVTGVAGHKPWKSGVPVNDQGIFELPGLGTGVGELKLSADGYAIRSASVPAGTESRSDLGRIAMYRTQSLLVRLHSSTPEDYSSYGVSISSDARYLPGIRFSADGTVRIDDVAPGIVDVVLEASNGSSESRSIRIHPGGRNTCEIELDGDPLEVEVIPASGMTLPEDATLGVHYVDRHGEQVGRGYDLPRAGAVHVDRIDADRVLIEVIADEGRVCLAAHAFDLPVKSSRKLTFEMRARSARVHVIDERHAPIVGANVFVVGHSGAIRWLQSITTDISGVALINELGPDDVFVGAYQAEYGALPCAQLSQGNANAGMVEITIPRGAETELYVRDGGEGLAGVEIELKDACDSSMTAGRLLAGTDGRIHFAHLAQGDYRVLVDHPGIWRSEQPITVGATPASITVQLRRLGSARIHAKSGAGTPVEGASVELVDVATGASVADWIEQGEVPSPANGLRTDSSGTLVIHGIPRGSYRCVVTTASGAVFERTLEVPPQATGELEAVVQ
jgi:hypothetical protein